MTRFVGYFLRGLVFLVPVVVTVGIFVFTFRKVDGWLDLPVPGAGVALVVTMVTLIGFLLTNYFARSVLGLVDRLLDRLPFVRLLHVATRDVMNAVAGEKRGHGRAVLVEVGVGLRAVGYVTRESAEAFGLADYVAVYFPQSYNFAGQVLLVDKARVTPLVKVEGQKVMTFIVSGGVAGA
ncbi:MAG: DUF502 domain-containing protein [Myxococcales bacterium]|nr:DUF502 domain-containing protein [Myxococcales bacterium]